MAKPSANLRLFAAIYPPPEVAAKLLEAIKANDLPAYRMTPVEQVHMTVQFIGDVPSADLEETVESVRRATAGLSSFSLKLTRLIALPQRGPARLIAAQTDAPATLLEIHRRLVTRLARQPRQRESDRFLPHFTLCRFRSPARGVHMDRALDVEAFTVQQIVLMRSTLSSSGAIHHQVAASALA